MNIGIREVGISWEGKLLVNGCCKEYEIVLDYVLMYCYLCNEVLKNICVVIMFIYMSEKLIMKEF